MDNDAVTVGRGRGRGRGRGNGQSILPAGLWESMRGDTEEDPEQRQQPAQQPQQPFPKEGPIGLEQFEDIDGVGHGKGRGKGKRGFDDDSKGKPIFKKGDWECPSCMNMNWGWRSHCNICNTAKPGTGDPEGVRDGIGGGFNERQERVAAAVSAEVAEDGFDDFGRRSKTNKSERSKREEAALQRLQAAYGFLLDPSQSGTSAGPTTPAGSTDGGRGGGFDPASRVKDAAKEFGFVKDNRKKESDRPVQNDKGRTDNRNHRRRDRSNSRQRRGSSHTRNGREMRNSSRDRRSRSRSHDRYRRDGRGRDRSRDRRYR